VKIIFKKAISSLDRNNSISQIILVCFFSEWDFSIITSFFLEHNIKFKLFGVSYFQNIHNLLSPELLKSFIIQIAIMFFVGFIPWILLKILEIKEQKQQKRS
jgi:hypothetical protein